MSTTTLETITNEIKGYTLQYGADLVGVASVDRLEQIIPSEQKPGRLLQGAKSVVSYGLGMLRGPIYSSQEIRLARHTAQKAMEFIDEIGFYLSKYIEKKGFQALFIPGGLPVDMEAPKKGMWGDLSLRHVAAEAGLGEIGLSGCLVTPVFGPRIYLGAVVTSLELRPDKPAEGVCLGEKCQRCIKACPVGAIHVTSGIDKRKCQPNAMPFGIGSLFQHLKEMVDTTERQDLLNLIYSTTTLNLWQSVCSKTGISAGCFECMKACPVGR